MHRALLVQEILLNIFCRHASRSINRDMAALARTCRAFKEPALDILWSGLEDPTPLSRCLSEISHYEVTQKRHWPHGSIKFYTFSRPLDRAEWDILRGYAHRVWRIQDPHFEFDWEFVRRTSLDFTPAEPLFPNLRSVHCEFAKETRPLLLLPFPSLTRFSVRLPLEVDLRTLHGPLRSLSETSPNIKELNIRGCHSTPMHHAIVSDATYSWSNIRWLHCPEICLDADNFVHLSHMPKLTELSCTLKTTLLAHTIPSGSLSLSALNCLDLRAASLVLISRLLSWARLPSITNFTVTIEHCPSKDDLTSFMAGLLTGVSHAVRRFSLEQDHEAPEYTLPREPDAPLLDLDDLRPCMAFHDLLHMSVDLQWDVDLQDNELLMLTSSWPRLEDFTINTNWGWNRPGGITPDGLTSLLRMCPSLVVIALVVDTRGYTDLSHRTYQDPIALPYPFRFDLNVLDSVIEEESVDAMASFLSSIVPHIGFILTMWVTLLEHPDSDLYSDRWEEVYRQANEALETQWLARAQQRSL